jgi:hypothetical protein
MIYATLTDLRQYLKLTDAETADDALLLRLLEQVSRNIESHCGRRFDVRLETRRFDYPLQGRGSLGFGSYSADDFAAAMSAAADVHTGRLRLDDDLLTATTITNGDGSEIDAASYVLEPANVTPAHAIRLKSGSGARWQPGGDGSREQVISVMGLWGYHLDYNRSRGAWVATKDTVQATLSAEATSLTVADTDGTANDGRSPRFQPGQLISIDAEFVEITGVSYTTNKLTVWRGVNGTTAAAHAAGVDIWVYRVPADIERAAIRWAAYLYRQKDASTMDTAFILGTGVKISTSAMPPDVIRLLPSPRRGVSGPEGLL